MMIVVSVVDDIVDYDEEADDDNDDKTTSLCNEHIFRHEGKLFRVYSEYVPIVLRVYSEHAQSKRGSTQGRPGKQ